MVYTGWLLKWGFLPCILKALPKISWSRSAKLLFLLIKFNRLFFLLLNMYLIFWAHQRILLAAAQANTACFPIYSHTHFLPIPQPKIAYGFPVKPLWHHTGYFISTYLIIMTVAYLGWAKHCMNMSDMNFTTPGSLYRRKWTSGKPSIYFHHRLCGLNMYVLATASIPNRIKISPLHFNLCDERKYVGPHKHFNPFCEYCKFILNFIIWQRGWNCACIRSSMGQ